MAGRSVAKHLVGKRAWNRVFFPNFRVQLMTAHTGRNVAASEYTFRVPTNMTKHEVRDYLGTIYGLEIDHVKTVVYSGKVKQKSSRHPKKKNVTLQKTIRQPSYKNAVVTLKNPETAAAVAAAVGAV